MADDRQGDGSDDEPHTAVPGPSDADLIATVRRGPAAAPTGRGDSDGDSGSRGGSSAGGGGGDDDGRDGGGDSGGGSAGGGGAAPSTAAFAELYDRHVEAARSLARRLTRSAPDADDLVAGAFTRVLEALRQDRGPTEAFRAYLLTTLRNLAHDRYRAERRVELTDDITDVVGVDPDRTIVPFADPALAGLERSLAARAFATLPERWQAVLWHLEVEGDSVADIAPLFGLSANAVSALAYRAREGLRQAYLQEHLSGRGAHADRTHRETQERLGAWTRGGLARREAARVEAHLRECEECRTLAAELRHVNSGMVRAVIAPLVLGVGLAGYLASRGSAPEYLTAQYLTGHLAAARVPGPEALAAWSVYPLSTLPPLAPSRSVGIAAAVAAVVAAVVGAVALVAAGVTGPDSAAEHTEVPDSTRPDGARPAQPPPPTPPPIPTAPPDTSVLDVLLVPLSVLDSSEQRSHPASGA